MQAPIPIARLIGTDQFDGLSSDGIIGPTVGRAEYTNGNFLSNDTLFTADFILPRQSSLSAGFFLPEGQGVQQYFSKAAEGQPNADGLPFGEGEGIDLFVAEGVLRDPLTKAGLSCDEGLVLTDRVFENYALLLLPRAVGYSAALIDYFFRGKIDLVEDENTPGAFFIHHNLSDEDLQGDVTLYYDAIDGERYPVAGDQATVTWEEQTIIALGQSDPLTFVAPVSPAPATPGEYMLVFTGTLGDEVPSADFIGAVVGKLIQANIGPGFLTPVGKVFFADGLWQLDSDTTLKYETVDWRGEGTDVLSWHASSTRMLNHLPPENMDTKIYRNGLLFAEAPGPVSGVALHSEAPGLLNLLAVVSGWADAPIGPPFLVRTDTIYRKILPDGVWEQIGTFSFPQKSFTTRNVDLWHFNPEGTEAILVKTFSEQTRVYTMNIVLETNSGSVSVSENTALSAQKVQAVDYDRDGNLKLVTFDELGRELVLSAFTFPLSLQGRVVFFPGTPALTWSYTEN